MIKDRILTVEQMKACERRSEELGVPASQLMATAGEKLASHVMHETMADGQPDTP